LRPAGGQGLLAPGREGLRLPAVLRPDLHLVAGEPQVRRAVAATGPGHGGGPPAPPGGGWGDRRTGLLTGARGGWAPAATGAGGEAPAPARREGQSPWCRPRGVARVGRGGCWAGPRGGEFRHQFGSRNAPRLRIGHTVALAEIVARTTREIGAGIRPVNRASA